VKNKKLFAILTLVCFMFTLMPVAAFAGDGDVIRAKVDSNLKTSVTVDVDEKVNFQYNKETTDTGKGLFIVKSGVLVTTTDALEYTFAKDGTYEVYAADETEIANVMKLEGKLKSEKLALLKDQATATENYVTVKVKPSTKDLYTIAIDYGYDNKDGANLVVPTNAKSEDIGEKYANGDDAEWNLTIGANNGWDDDGHLTATLLKHKYDSEKKTYAAGVPVEDVELTFTEVGYADVVLADGAETDFYGNVDFEVVGDRTGDYKVIVKYGNKAEATLNVKVQASEVANVTVLNTPNAPVDVDGNVQFVDIEFKFVDANNNAYAMELDTDKVTVKEGSAVKVDVTSKPADSNADDADFTLVKEWDDADGVYSLAGTFDEEGKYTIKVSLENGKSAEVTVEAMEQGEIVGIKYDVYNTPITVAYGSATAVNNVVAYDANGVLSAPTGVQFSANGAAIAKFNYKWDADQKDYVESPGFLIVKGDDDFIGSKITVMAELDGFTTTTVLTVVDVPATINFAAANAEVGINAEFKGTVLDGEGKMSSVAQQITKVTTLVLDKPADAVVATSADYDLKGNIYLNFIANKAGEYKVQVAANYGDNNFVAGTAVVTVGGVAGEFNDVVVISMGADSMIVNNELVKLDVAPYIENNRTMMQYNVLGAFGFDIQWVQETRSVVAEGNGIKVVMNIDSKVATVNGEEVTLDVAPTIVNGRTVVPVGFLTGTFGITPNFVYGEAGLDSILFTK